MRFRIRTLFVVVAIAAVISLGLSWLNRANQSLRGAYAVWWVANMCVEHMDANNGEWPRSWDDLRDDYQTCVARSGQPWTFGELSQRVEVDWDANPSELLPIADNSHPDLHVIWLRNGSEAHWKGREPNQIILNYLKSQSEPDG